MAIYTKGGDQGQTGLLGGSRISKGSLRVECYGGVDELNALLGLAYAASRRDDVRAWLQAIQKRLFALAAELASDAQGLSKIPARIGDDDVQGLEQVIDTCMAVCGPQREFVIPGRNTVSATLHVARTVARRGERLLVRLAEQEEVQPVLLRYLNRLSDAIYALARYEEFWETYAELRGKIRAAIAQRLQQEEISMDNNHPTVNLDMMRKTAARAREKAAALGVPIVFAAVDIGGNLVLLERMDDSLLASIDIAMHKAFTAVALRMPTHQLAAKVQPGGELYGIESTNLGKIVPFGGGYPLYIEGHIAGAIGISGGSVAEDMEIATYALAAY